MVYYKFYDILNVILLQIIIHDPQYIHVFHIIIIPVTVTARNETLKITGLFFQARSGTWASATKQGTFSEDSEKLQTISCPLGTNSKVGFLNPDYPLISLLKII